MPQAKTISIVSQAEAALKMAVKKVVKEHARTGTPLIVWKKGRVVKEWPSGSLKRKHG